MRGGNGGFQCTVRLTREEKRQTTTIDFRPISTESIPQRHTTALEARHVAATYALHRLRSNTNMHMMLPPVHRNYWLELEKLRKESGANSAWKYTTDPFAAQTAHDQQVEEKTRKRQLKAKEERNENLLSSGQKKRWEDLPQVRMSESNRELVEQVVRTWTDSWGGLKPGDLNHETKRLEQLGFRSAHITEALEQAPGQALDWLCVHVPEDDLPSQLLQRAGGVAVIVQQEQQGLQISVNRLAKSGFPTSLVRSTIKQNLHLLEQKEDNIEYDVAEAWSAHILLSRLCLRTEESPRRADLETDSERQMAVSDEIAALEAVYADENRISETKFCVGVRLENTGIEAIVQLQFWLPPGLQYPTHEAAAVTFSSDGLPAYLKLHAAQMLDTHLRTCIGMPAMLEAVGYAEEHLAQWIAAPPPLAELMGGMLRDNYSQTNGSESNGGSDAESGKEPSNTNNSKSRNRRMGNRNHLTADTSRLCAEFAKLQHNDAYRKMQQTRARLPAAEYDKHIASLVQSNRCVVVSGATGCGKTTQVPQFLLDRALQKGEYINIVCTQPRRLSAIGVATRVASERGENINTMHGTVGYSVRNESRRGRDTRLLFCTTGVLLRMLTDDPDFKGITHVICDEVHERSVDSDLLLVLLRRSLKRNHQLRVVLMSATAQSDVFAAYFGFKSPVVEIPGRTFPVEDVFVEDLGKHLSPDILQRAFGKSTWDSAQSRITAVRKGTATISTREWVQRVVKLAEKSMTEESTAASALLWDERHGRPEDIDFSMAGGIVAHIHATAPIEQAVLVFVPGVAEIDWCTTAIRRSVSGAENTLRILPLHAGLSPTDQQRVFQNSNGQRKVIVATNVAETSITVEDVCFVIDSGRVRELRIDPNSRVARLTTVFCSQAASTQRRGRAGRVQNGVCFRLYTRDIMERLMPAYGDPEIQRAPLEQVCLQAKALGYSDASDLLSQTLDPPDDSSVLAAERLLVIMGVCENVRGPLLALGRILARIPTDLRLAKMLVIGTVLGLGERALRLAALVGLDRSLYAISSLPDARAQLRALRLQTQPNSAMSDWLADLSVFERCLENPAYGAGCVSATALRNARTSMQMLRRSLIELGLLDEIKSADNVEPSVMRAVLLAGLSPNIARVRLPPTKFREAAGGSVAMEREARELAFYATDEHSAENEHTWLAHDRRMDRRVFIHPQSLLFEESRFSSPFVVFLDQSASAAAPSKTYLRDVTVPGLYALLLFGPQPLHVDHANGVVSVGPTGGLAMRAWPRIGVLAAHLRRLLDELLRRKFENPRMSIHDHPIVDAVLHLIRSDGR
ncbi:P-loop containing nucleoside triphosphate hydrolase protein [Coemansia reversa NRRL 1564]|uniref:RNA helicase n=1 Tax=Coemansia reversa (strain ATCC 12441 / NRRL 1564) TaxID=763665 RepID=A0A2G5B379_COERN|nr:P-loop containing nucleoside triphosphate hydrolase protein [Coemansia reversa NRRL 1564]|eukprot:PIA13479.1 P-loop containing nucleoside triphosphate hydrolase protein [Coemansia reversa NRRL 1564]